MKIVIDGKIPFIKGVLEPFADIEYYPGSSITRDKIKDADALIIRTRTKCNEALLEGTNVKFIATATIGFDHIDTTWCEKNNIAWTNAPGCNSSSVQQHVASALAYLARKHQFMLEDRTIGIVGVGNVGRRVMRIAEYYGMRVVLNDPPIMRKVGPCGYVSLDGILRESDIITFHVPLNMEGEDKTWQMFDRTFLAKVNPGTFIINTSRGEVVIGEVLKEGLKSGKIAGAVLDVWENEPDIDLDLLNMVDIATPHIAGYSQDGKANGTAMAVQAVSRFFNLPYEDWFPGDIPVPETTQIHIDCTGKTQNEVIMDAVSATYAIEEDHKRLVSEPGKFEWFRGNYPVRREFDTYKLVLSNPHEGMLRVLMKIGFDVSEKE